MADNKQLKNNEQIKFLHGTQAALDNMMKSTATAEDKAKIEAGAFYFTTDSHRMYLAQADKTIVPVNDSIQKIASINALPDTKYADSSVSTFYYCIAENVLCIGVPDDANGWKWIQINPDTSITNRTFNASKATGSRQVKVTDTLTDSNGTNYTAFWGFDEEGGNVTITVANKTYTENGSSVTRQVFTIKCNVEIGTEQNNNAGIIKLTNSGDDSKKVTIKPANDAALTVKSDNAGIITINDQGLRDADITSIDQAFDGEGNLTTILYRGTDANLQDTVTPIIEYGKDAETEESTATAVFADGTAVLDVYTTTEVDNKIAKELAIANAMTFIGVLSPDSETHKTLPTTNVRIGDTYKVGKNRSYDTNGNAQTTGTTWAIMGDLFIATGDEGDDGYITSNLKWEHVPAGNEESVDYTFSTQTHGLKVDSGNDTLLDFKLAEGTAITLRDTTTTDSKGRTVTINHANVDLATGYPKATTTSQQMAEKIENDNDIITSFEKTTDITYVTEVLRNAQGHVTGIATETATLIDTNAFIKEVSLGVANTQNTTNSVTLTSKVTLQHPSDTTDNDDFDDDSIVVKSLNDNLAVAVDSGAITFNLVWGTF